MTIETLFKKDIIYLDGGFGTMLQAAGLKAGENSADWNFSHPDVVEDIHRQYLEAGADVIAANTFGVNVFRCGERTSEYIKQAIYLAKKASKGYKNRLVALDLGPTGKLLQPLGDLGFEDAVNAFKECVRAGVEAGADLVMIETVSDIYEAKAAILAVKEQCSLPVFATCVFGADAKTMTGSSPEAVAAVLEGLGADAIGLNCSLSPEEMLPVCERFISCASVPVVVKPNAGLPDVTDGSRYTVDEQKFALGMRGIVALGAKIVGGCCGTTPAYIRELIEKTSGMKPAVTQKNLTVVASYTHAVTLGDGLKIIGERINPTGKKRLKEALKNGDTGYILGEAVAQAEAGAHILDVNVGVPGTDEAKLLPAIVREIQTVTDLPLQIDTSSPAAMEAALRIYNGKPLINSVDGKKESMANIFPLVKKYGGAVIALTLDENGIPPTAEGRVAIAKRILSEAAKYGIDKKDIIFDTLATSVAADGGAATATLDALFSIRRGLGANTSLGVSNVSFGLPAREIVNSAFFIAAMQAGLSAAIINPLSHEMIKAYKAFAALSGRDKGCLEYIDYASRVQPTQAIAPSAEKLGEAEKVGEAGLEKCILRGFKERAAEQAAALLKTIPPVEVIEGHIVPALDEVGKGFEEKKIYLPQLMMSAEAAGAAFDVIKRALPAGAVEKKLKIVLATVKGDVHDSGKNIVKSLLENYGFCVLDLGKDVPPEKVLKAAKECGADLVGLSALMTTTVAAMEQTVGLIKSELSECKTAVGGAVITEEYARSIGADKYCADAMATVRYAEQLEEEIKKR